MAQVTIDATQGYKQTGIKKNVNNKYDSTIKLLKKWTAENFYFNNNVVHYLNPDADYTTVLDKSIKCNEVIYKKSEFDTPLSHMMYILIVVGKTMEEDERKEAIAELCNSLEEDSDM